MKRVTEYIKASLLYILSYFPTALPVGMEEFKNWQSAILSMSKVPDNESTRFASAVMILHLDAASDRKPMRYFIKALNKSAANECANFVAMELKEKQKARIEAEKKQQAAEAEAKALSDGLTRPEVQEASK